MARVHRTRFAYRVPCPPVCHAIGLALLGLVGVMAALVAGASSAPALASGPGYCSPPVEAPVTRPALQLNRREGPVGTNLLVVGTPWSPGTHVTIHLDARDPHTGELRVLTPDLASGTAQPDGSLGATPFNASDVHCTDIRTDRGDIRYAIGDAGSVALLVGVTDKGEASAPVSFTYLVGPSVVVNGQRGFGEATTGTSLVVAGSSWEPGADMTLSLRGGLGAPASAGALLASLPSVHAQADDHGTFLAWIHHVRLLTSRLHCTPGSMA